MKNKKILFAWVLLLLIGLSSVFIVPFFFLRRSELVRMPVEISSGAGAQIFEVVVIKNKIRAQQYYEIGYFLRGSNLPMTGQVYIIYSDSIDVSKFAVNSNPKTGVKVSFNAEGLYPKGQYLFGNMNNDEQTWKMMKDDER